MKLEELKQMVAEEYAKYKNELTEQGADMPPMPGAPKDPTVAVSDGDVDPSEDSAEDTLRQIFDMLKDFFEGGDDASDDATDAADDVEDDADDADDDADDMEESTSTGKNAGYKPVKESIKKIKQNRILAESKLRSRFKTLANIKK